MPLVAIAASVDKELGKWLLMIAISPILLAGIAITVFIGAAPLFVRKPMARLIAVPIIAFIAYALGGETFALAYIAALLVAWAAVSAWRALMPGKIKPPASAPYRRAQQ
ncbi:hypothetical protein GGR90_002764 [Sphingopyxis italica]|uniref:Uncharacterized protein n=1 Tax=Sphingopyxis italica TaxID=1129133 RepID=A0A7X5XSQ3_9SPHN|nr:hypothetical protein [Sphingopyxis italica]NJB90570.1 hypothetical protein [Sphingopyxis italica]